MLKPIAKLKERLKERQKEKLIKSGKRSPQPEMYKKPSSTPEESYKYTMKKGGAVKKSAAKKPLSKAQKGTVVEGPISTKKTIFGRTKITRSEEGNYPFETSKAIRTDVYNKEGDWVKSKRKSTVTDKATGDSYTYKIKSKSRGENQEPKKRLSRAIIPVKKTGGAIKSKKK